MENLKVVKLVQLYRQFVVLKKNETYLINIDRNNFPY